MDTDHKTEKAPPGRLLRIVQVIGAITVTAIALWLMLGVPAVLLFEVFF